MARLLNNNLIVLFLMLSFFGFAQTGTDADAVQRPKDQKGGEEFKKYSKRAEIISKWQINQLKNGALMVRLHTNQMKIDALKKMGKMDLATIEENEIFIINKNIVRAFITNYNFSKVYFFYSNQSDTLMHGAKSGMFLDTNLVIDPSIKYEGKFYLVAEEGLSYASSIGFIREDSARYASEAGTTPTECYVVTKNRYYQQLKYPFPFRILYKGISEVMVDAYAVTASGKLIKSKISKSKTAIKFNRAVSSYNKNLIQFYNENKGYEVTDPSIKPFLY